jgi:hypothetical protein
MNFNKNKELLIDYIRQNLLKICIILTLILIIILAIFYFFTRIYMRNNEQKVIAFDLDETLGCFVELGAFCDIIENYNNKKLTFNDFYKIMDLFPEFQRHDIVKILAYLKEKKRKKNIDKVFIYTNNQGPKQWATNISAYFERKINYKLFDKIIGAYKVNGKIIEYTRTTHNKTVHDFLNSTDLSDDTKICFVDDLYHPHMDTKNVYYIKINPYVNFIPYDIMAERYYNHMKINDDKSDFINYVVTNMNRYNLHKTAKTKEKMRDDIINSKYLLKHLQQFIKETKSTTKKSKPLNSKNKTRKS